MGGFFMRYRIKAFGILISIILTEVLVINGIHLKLVKQVQLIEEERVMYTETEKKINHDLQCFPIPLSHRENIAFEDSFGAYRDNGGHEGCDIMSVDNIPGKIPVVSATDGVVTNVGWLYLGGYRIGITSESGIYYYYAHFDSCAESIIVGKKINAGELLGFMGNTGEGEEGTKGNFPVHLHFGIYVKDENGNEKCVNPYPFLREIIAE